MLARQTFLVWTGLKTHLRTTLILTCYNTIGGLLTYGSSFLQVCDLVIDFASYNSISGTEEVADHSSSTKIFPRVKGQPLKKKINVLKIFATSSRRN